MTAAQLMMMRGDDEKTRKPLQRIMSSGDRMARMIDQLLDFTRVRVGEGIPLARKHLDLKPVIELVVEELDAPNADNEIAVECRGDTSGPWDGDRLAQVFSNLIGNAVRHGHQAGRVTVALDGTARHALRVTVHNLGTVPAERIKRLFEPMMGTDRRGDKAEGLGLGLFISHEIVRAHGGSIAVESSESAGTSFHVTLPRATA
jgi:signal transduction histidine kinase